MEEEAAVGVGPAGLPQSGTRWYVHLPWGVSARPSTWFTNLNVELGVLLEEKEPLDPPERLVGPAA